MRAARRAHTAPSFHVALWPRTPCPRVGRGSSAPPRPRGSALRANTGCREVHAVGWWRGDVGLNDRRWASSLALGPPQDQDGRRGTSWAPSRGTRRAEHPRSVQLRGSSSGRHLGANDDPLSTLASLPPPALPLPPTRPPSLLPVYSSLSPQEFSQASCLLPRGLPSRTFSLLFHASFSALCSL